MLAHWARVTLRPVLGALLATPPDFERPMPDGYPSIAALESGGWLPVPRQRLPFPSIVAASRNDPLGAFDRVAELARGWGSRLVDLGSVGHLNPASGFGEWPMAESLISELEADGVPVAWAELGITPMAYLWRERVEHGIDLLRSTGLSVGEVASRAGFSSVYHFSRRVKALSGLSPSQMRVRSSASGCEPPRPRAAAD